METATDDRDLMDILFDPKPEPKVEIIIDRSTLDSPSGGLETYRSCPMRCALDAEKVDVLGLPDDEDTAIDIAEQVSAARNDADGPAVYLRDCGIEFHGVMSEYIEYLLGAQERSNPGVLIDMAKGADSTYQPDVLHCAKLTGPRISVWPGSYIGHEKQYAYRLPAFGLNKEDVILTTRPDYLEYGNTPAEIVCKDWKTGYKKGGHDFQAMFVSVVLWRSMEGVESVSWQPFYNRFGQWGKRFQYIDGPGKPWELSLQDAEDLLLQAVTNYLMETDWKARPGYERCRTCPYTHFCPGVGGEIDEDPIAYANDTGRLAAELKDRKAKLKAYAQAKGPIQTDDGWWGVNVISTKPTFRLNKGTPGFLEDDDSGDEDAE